MIQNTAPPPFQKKKKQQPCHIRKIKTVDPSILEFKDSVYKLRFLNRSWRLFYWPLGKKCWQWVQKASIRVPKLEQKASWRPALGGGRSRSAGTPRPRMRTAEPLQSLQSTGPGRGMGRLCSELRMSAPVTLRVTSPRLPSGFFGQNDQTGRIFDPTPPSLLLIASPCFSLSSQLGSPCWLQIRAATALKATDEMWDPHLLPLGPSRRSHCLWIPVYGVVFCFFVFGVTGLRRGQGVGSLHG